MGMKVKNRVVASATLAIFVFLAWITGSVLHLSGWRLWVLRAGLAILGVSAAGLIFAFMRQRGGKARTARDTDDDRVKEVFASIRSRLASARGVQTARLGKLPLVLFAGPTGSTKTSLILNSGLDPELLAGHGRQEGLTVPTDTAAAWLAGDAVMVEAGGPLLDEEKRWRELARYLVPDRWAAVFSRGTQAPRSAVVCFGCDDFLKPGASEAVIATARKLRTRLTELVSTLGIRLPVYVMFTKADRLPYFDDFVRNLSDAEAREVLGATLRLDGSQEGTYAERESRRIAAAFDALFGALGRRRPIQLLRESDPKIRAGIYEFPREFRKITDLATQFLVELGRPTRLGVSPVLRGFYFTGVRAVTITDPLAGSSSPAPQSGGGTPAGATAVFNPATMRSAPEAPRSSSGRRAAQWTFLGRFLPEIVLRDEVARAMTAGGRTVNLVRRTLLAAVIAAVAVTSVGMMVSYVKNRRLAKDVTEALTGVEGIGPTEGAPAVLDDLQRLDDLRVQAARLSRYEQGGPPTSLRWGMYRGDDLEPRVRRAYFDRFRKLLWDDAFSSLVSTLRSLPPKPDASGDYTRTYGDLRAYLVMTRYPDSASAESLAPTLARHVLLGGQAADDTRSRLVRAQFDFYASELPRGNPFDASSDATLVAGTRTYLGEFTDSSAFYDAMLRQASVDAQPVDWRTTTPVRSPVVVPAAFTREGWTRVHDNLKDVDALFAREDWVTGEQTPADEDLARLADALEARYLDDYVQVWQDFLRQATVLPYGGLSDASTKLRALAANRSPLMGLLETVARNTEVGNARVDSTFQPVSALATPDSIAAAGVGYLQALSALESAVSQAAATSGSERDMAVQQASGMTQQATLAVASATRAFSGDPRTEGVSRSVEALLRAPITGAQRALGNVGIAERNAQGRDLCRAFTSLSSHYPFRTAGSPARMDDVAAFFQPGTGALWRLYDQTLTDLIGPQGNRYAALPGASPTPRADFVRFFDRAATVSQAFFRPDGTGPMVEFRPVANATPDIPEITIMVGGTAVTFTQTQRGGRSIRWDGREVGSARIRGRVGGEDVTLVDAPAGPWSIFHLFDNAEWTRMGDRRYRATWHPTVGGRQLSLIVDLLFPVDAPVFDAHWLGALQCVSRIVG
ncbi:MAG: ImcF-related family protein [Gemmatimonadota bacterium]|jgi:type VI secretion system protein ImpL